MAKEKFQLEYDMKSTPGMVCRRCEAKWQGNGA